jgi:predicted transcriptional regulator
MQLIKRAPIRNKINLTDPGQVRAWTRRLGVPADELKAVVEKVGNSVAAVTKEVELRRASQQPPQVAPSASITDEPEKSIIPAQA